MAMGRREKNVESSYFAHFSKAIPEPGMEHVHPEETFLEPGSDQSMKFAEANFIQRPCGALYSYPSRHAAT
jgi:hypothetical protein